MGLFHFIVQQQQQHYASLKLDKKLKALQCASLQEVDVKKKKKLILAFEQSC